MTHAAKLAPQKNRNRKTPGSWDDMISVGAGFKPAPTDPASV